MPGNKGYFEGYKTTAAALKGNEMLMIMTPRVSNDDLGVSYGYWRFLGYVFSVLLWAIEAAGAVGGPNGFQ